MGRGLERFGVGAGCVDPVPGEDPEGSTDLDTLIGTVS